MSGQVVITVDVLMDEARKEERQRIAAYVLDQLLGAGHDSFDVTLAPSLIREVAEAIRDGRY